MKLAISTQGPDLKSPIDLRFGRARYFRIVDIETGQQTAVDNAKAYSQGQLVVETVPGLQPVFDQLLLRLLAEVRTEGRLAEVRQDLEGAIRASLEPPARGSPNAAGRSFPARVPVSDNREKTARAAPVP